MNWGRVKTVFIILFLISDLFLLGILIGSEWRQKRISAEVMQSTVQILKNNSVNISMDIIPEEIDSAPYAEVENVIADYDSFATLVLGDTISRHAENTYESDTGVITFHGNSFSFASKLSGDADTPVTEKNAENVATEALLKIGFNLKTANVSSKTTDNVFEVTFENEIHNLPVFNSKIIVQIANDRVISISGAWFNHIDANGADNNLKSISSMLIDAIPDFDTSNGELTVTSLSLGYNIPEHNTSHHKSAVLFPVWEICDANGSVYYTDARKPQ